MTSPVIFVIAVDRSRTDEFLNAVKTAHEEAKGMTSHGSFASAFVMRLSFHMMMCSPFTFLGENNTKAMGYEVAAHAQHVSRLHGWPEERLAYIQVELTAEAFQRLSESGAIANVSRDEKKIWSIDAYAMLEVTEPDLKMTVKTAVELGL